MHLHHVLAVISVRYVKVMYLNKNSVKKKCIANVIAQVMKTIITHKISTFERAAN